MEENPFQELHSLAKKGPERGLPESMGKLLGKIAKLRPLSPEQCEKVREAAVILMLRGLPNLFHRYSVAMRLTVLFDCECPSQNAAPSYLSQDENWRDYLAVHRAVLQRIMNPEEQLIHQELGVVRYANSNRYREGAIFVTDERFFTIGMGNTIGESFVTRPHLWYPDLGESGKAYYGSLDYLQLSKLQDIDLELKRRPRLRLTFRDIRYMTAKPQYVYGPLCLNKRIRNNVEDKTGEFGLDVTLEKVKGQKKEDLHRRFVLLMEMIESASDTGRREVIQQY